MTQFEFVSVALSIVLALSAARLLSALGYVFAPGRRYWVHALWCLILLAGHLTFWWAIWELHDVESWSFRAFGAAMFTPAVLYLMASALVTEDPASVASWRAHFHARHRVFFALFFATGLSVPFRQFVVVGEAELPLGFGAPLFLGLLSMGLIGIFVKGERFHAFLVTVLVAASLISLVRL